VDRDEGGWHDCQVLDVSASGALLEVLEAAPLLHSALSIDLRLEAKGSIEAVFNAQLRRVEPTEHTATRLGIEWTPLDPSEEHALALLLALHADQETGS